MTAGAMVADREKCFAAGMDDYLSKPVKAPELEAVLHRWITGTGAQPPDAGAEAAEPDPGAGPDGEGMLDAVQFDGLRQLAAASGDPGFLRGFVDRYVDQAESQVAELRRAAARGDATVVGELAHGLKGTSATMGASRVASACATLERSAARGEVTGPDGLDRVAIELDRATAVLRARAAGS